MPNKLTLQKEIEIAINRASAECASDTPDFILAEYLADCLSAWNKASRARENWYGRRPKLAGNPPAPPAEANNSGTDKPLCVSDSLNPKPKISGGDLIASFFMNITEDQIKQLVASMPRDRNGTPIIPCETYRTTDGVECRPHVVIVWSVSVTQGDRYRECTAQDVVLANV
jgi:hypothetical protein